MSNAVSLRRLRHLAVENYMGTAKALLLFGSATRDEVDKWSDIDILQIGSCHKRSYSRGRLNFSVYSRAELFRFAKLGSLFVAHLVHEGVALVDPLDFLCQLTQSFVAPENYSDYRTSLKRCLPLVAEDNISESVNERALSRTAYFLLRSWLFSLSYDQGNTRFSMHMIADELDLPEVLMLRKRKLSGDLNRQFLHDTITILERMMGISATNPYVSVEAAIVNAFSECDLAVSLGLRILAQEDIELPYQQIGIWHPTLMQ